MSIPGHHLRWFSETVRQIYVARTQVEMNRALLPAMHRHLDLTIALCESATLDFTQTSLEAAVSHYAPPKDFQLHMGDCPSLLRAMAGDRSPQLHFWDAGRAMENTHFYNFLCRPFGVRDQVINAVWGPERLTVFSASRDRLFTSGEQALLALLHPHLTAGLLRVDGARPAAAAPFGHPWVGVDSKGKPIGLTAEQDALLRAYFPAAKSYRHDWPEPIARWLAAVRVALAKRPLIDPPPAMQAESTRGRLGFRYFPDPAGTGGSVRLIENPAATNWVVLGLRAGLSPRESEVAHWLAFGKRDSEIAQILGLSTATASRHTHHILKKLGLGSRSGVMAALAKRGGTDA